MALQIVRWEKGNEPPNKVFLEKELKGWGFRTEFWVDKPGTHYRDFRHPVDEIVWVLRGQARIELEGESATLAGGDRIRIPKDTRHSLEVVGAETLYWLAAFHKSGPRSSGRAGLR